MKASLWALLCLLSIAQSWADDRDAASTQLDLGAIRIDVGLGEDGELGLIASGEENTEISALTTPLIFAMRNSKWTRGGQFRSLAKYSLSLDSSLTTANAANTDMSVAFKFAWGGTFAAYSAEPARPTAQVVEPDTGSPIINGTALPESVTTSSLPNDWFALMPFVDVRYRHSKVAGATGSSAKVTQHIAGLGLELLVLAPSLVANNISDLYPRLIVGYYSVLNNDRDNEADIALPEGLAANHFAAQLNMQSRLPFGQEVGQTGVLLDVEIAYSRPERSVQMHQGGWIRTFKLLFESDKLPGGLSPALVYRSGNSRGLELDRQVLLAVGAPLLQ